MSIFAESHGVTQVCNQVCRELNVIGFSVKLGRTAHRNTLALKTQKMVMKPTSQFNIPVPRKERIQIKEGGHHKLLQASPLHREEEEEAEEEAEAKKAEAKEEEEGAEEVLF